eukprot:COSAG06_NODE_27841_length_585_cov_1.154321_1_plen_99_part_10
MSAILTVGSMWRRCQGSYVQYGSATATVLPLLPPAGHLCACASSTCLTVPCNTVHYFLNQIRDEIPVTFVHLIESYVAQMKAQHTRSATLLSTVGTIQT